MSGAKGHTPGPASVQRVLRNVPADKEEIKGLKLQIKALNGKIQNFEQYGREKKKDYQELEKKYEVEKKSRQDLQNKLKRIVPEADKKEIEGLKLQIEALNDRNQSWEKKYEHEKRDAERKKKERDEWKKKYEDLRKKLCGTCKRIN